ncbi:GDSL-type esterase/lipase family protein [Thomasclavelia saccharogumia]|uniref:GDSL-type esterase/lipase family protein n=1 Tax=Thomasclavelia saccharogumia TaxID=341225 RepID=UPI00047D9299|nr:GDSL-type esterase/lipase family protein [Thomasclavelia saccharogumia]
MKESMKFLTNHYQLREFVLTRMLQIIEQTKTAQKGGVVFFGDSITQFCDLDKFYFEIDNKYNCGIAGITSKILLNFIDESVIKYRPSKVVIMIGTNDLGNTVMESPRDIALNVKEMIEIIHYNCLDAKIYLVSALPCLEKYHGYRAEKQGMRSNDILKMIFKEYKNVIPYEYVTFINAYGSICNKKGEPIEEYYVDGLHINEKGYEKYTEFIKKSLLK